MTASLTRRRLMGQCIALLLIVSGWGVPLAFPHLAADDLLCAVPAAGDGHPTVLTDASGTHAPDHCAVCHMLRSFRSAGPANGFSGLALDSAGHQPMALRDRADGSAFPRLSSRAPPA